MTTYVDYLQKVVNGKITDDDMVLMLSIDRAQFYKNKSSDIWIWIWVVVNHAPGVCYQKKRILSGGFSYQARTPLKNFGFIPIWSPSPQCNLKQRTQNIGHLV